MDGIVAEDVNDFNFDSKVPDTQRLLAGAPELSEFLDEDYDTLGGLLIKTFGRLPKEEETIDLKTIQFRILQADNRRLQSIEVKKID